VKFLVDAQLPKRLCDLLISKGFDAIHTLHLPKGNLTSDGELIEIADSGNRIIITKDGDFLDNYLLHGSPKKLLLVTTGNVSNNVLIDLFERYYDQITSQLNSNSVVELSSSEILVHF